MGILLRKPRFSGQPTGSLRLSSNHPLTPYCVGVWLSTDPLGLLHRDQGRIALTRTGTTQEPGATREGTRFGSSYAATDIINLPNTDEAKFLAVDGSILVGATVGTLATNEYRTMWAIRNGSTQVAAFVAALDTGNYVGGQVGFNCGAQDSYAGAGSAKVGQYATYGVQWGSLGRRMYVNGALASTNANNAQVTNNSIQPSLGNRQTGGRSMNGLLHWWAGFSVNIGDDWYAALNEYPWQLLEQRRQAIFLGGASGSTYNAITSLGAAVQAARDMSASASAGVQVGRTAASSVSGAVVAAASAQTQLDGAVQALQARVTSVEAAVQAGQVRTAALDAALSLARSAGAALDLAVSAQRSGTATLSAQVQAGSAAAASLDAFVQSGSSVSVSLAAAILRQALGATSSVDAALQFSPTATASLGGALQVARAATAVIDAALQVARSGSASVSAQVQSGTSLSVGVEAAIRDARAAVASVQAALSIVRAATLSLTGAVVVQLSTSALADGAVSVRRTMAAALSAYVEDPSSTVGTLDVVALRSIVTQLVSLASQPKTIVSGDSRIGE